MAYVYLKINGIASDPPLAALHDPDVLANCIAKGMPTIRKLADLPVAVVSAIAATD